MVEPTHPKPMPVNLTTDEERDIGMRAPRTGNSHFVASGGPLVEGANPVGSMAATGTDLWFCRGNVQKLSDGGDNLNWCERFGEKDVARPAVGRPLAAETPVPVDHRHVGLDLAHALGDPSTAQSTAQIDICQQSAKRFRDRTTAYTRNAADLAHKPKRSLSIAP
ncbi:hypothetical protein IVA88_28105 [Bradyrhizobium sp. 149]|nr:hypothetical protein [Bradyrhizobium sp. 149]